MAPNTARKLATYADLEALPEDVKAEILDGVIEVQSGSPMQHGTTQGNLYAELRGFSGGRGGPGGWWIAQDMDVRLPSGEIVRPDLSGWRRERLLNPWSKLPIDVVPDWICEVVSPTPRSRRRDRVRKRHLYAASDVAFYWLLDPDERTLEALQLREGTWTILGTYDDTAVARIAPFDAVELEVGGLFPPSEEDDRAESDVL